MQNFFQTIAPVASQVELSLTIKAKDGIVSVMLIPKAAVKDAAAGALKPIVISGTPEELDSEFLNAIWQPLIKTAGIMHNIAEFESAADKLAKENSAAKAQEDAEKAKKEEAAKKYKAAIDKADKAIETKEYQKALDALNEAKLHAEKPETVDARIEVVKAKFSQPSLL